jgi:hypothetical protein
MRSVTENQLIAAVGTVERLVGRFFRDMLPPLPVHLKEPAVRFVPWVCIVTGALGLLVWLAGLGVIAFASAVTFWLELAFLAPSEASILYGPVAAYFLQPLTLVFSLIGGLLMLGRNPGGWYLVFLVVPIWAAIDIYRTRDRFPYPWKVWVPAILLTSWFGGGAILAVVYFVWKWGGRRAKAE